MIKISILPLLIISIYATCCAAQSDSIQSKLLEAADLFNRAANFNTSAAHSELGIQNEAYEEIKNALYDIAQNNFNDNLGAKPNISIVCALQGIEKRKM